MPAGSLRSLAAFSVVLVITVSLAFIPVPAGTVGSSSTSTLVPVDTSGKSVSVVGEHVGELEGQEFAGWYTDTVAADAGEGVVAIAWVRVDADSQNNDYVYLRVMRLDSSNASLTTRSAWQAGSITSLDSIVIGGGRILVTWTYINSYGKEAVAAALYTLDGEEVWRGNVRTSDTYHNEWSRACYVSGAGKFLIVWYTSDGAVVEGKWLSLDGTLSTAFTIDDTNGLYYQNADQMLCIGGSNKALVVFRKWDSNEGKPDLYAALVDTSSNVQEIQLYDYDGSEETVGVRGAYTGGYFLVPLLSGSYVRYDVVRESDGYVYHRDYVTGSGEHPYVIALSDRFVLAWIDHYNDADGEPKIANIDLSDFYIHPQYGVSVTGGDSYVDKHPLIAYDSSSGKLLYIWTSNNGNDYDIKYAIINLESPTDTPSVESTGVLVSGAGDQVADGLGLVGLDRLVVAYRDNSYKGVNELWSYVELETAESVSTINLYMLPRDADSYKSLLQSLVSGAAEKIYVAVAFIDWPEFLEWLVDAKHRGVDVRVIMDDSTGNIYTYQYLTVNGVPVINDTSAPGESHIMHDKFIVVDGSKLVVATTNLIESDLAKNNNTAIYIESRVAAYYYEKEFLHMWNNGNGRFGIDKTESHSFVGFISYSGRTLVLEAHFTPTSYGDPGEVPNVIAGYITRASSKVYFTAYIFTTSGWVTPIYDAIVEAKDNGIDVKGVFDELMNLHIKGRRIYDFMGAGVPCYVDTHPYKMHAKLFTVDDTLAVLGSWNPTYSATFVHDENILIIKDPDTTGGIAKQLADWIGSMVGDSNHFALASGTYRAPHLLISEVMFKPDDTGSPDGEWVEIYNPLDTSVNLSNYLIGDAETLVGSSTPLDDESLYRFPRSAEIPSGGYVIVAYKASVFEATYGFKPDYEIVDTDPSVPDMTLYKPDTYGSTWNLDDQGDEVLLIRIENNEFLQVISAVWYGSSTYLPGAVDTSSLQAGETISRSDPALDSAYSSTIMSVEQPTPKEGQPLYATGKFTIANNPPEITEITLYESDESTVVDTEASPALSPTQEYALKIVVSDANGYSDIRRIVVWIYHATPTSDEPSDSFDTSREAIFVWDPTLGWRMASSSSNPSAPSDTTWSLESGSRGPVDSSGSQAVWWLHFKVGKVSMAADGSSEFWLIKVRAEDAGGGVDEKRNGEESGGTLVTYAMSWYGEIGIIDTSFTFGEVQAGGGPYTIESPEDQDIDIYIVSNGGYKVQVSTSATWSGPETLAVVQGTPGADQIALALMENGNPAQYLGSTYADWKSGSGPTSDGNASSGVGDHYEAILGLYVGPGAKAGTYSGYVYFKVVNT